jgi:hypothetical protein
MSAVGWLRAGGLAMVAVGLMHLSGHFSKAPSDLAFRALEAGMQAYRVTLFGVETSFWGISEDLGISFSVFSFLAGGLCLAGADALGPRLRLFALVCAVGVAALIAVSVWYKVLPPALTYGIALVCFTLAFLRARSRA